ncbi:UDP-GalNAc:beta-1,3-N-acetylgalactosaminyltransferase 1 isoform X3 [Lepidochelys kempii]|uniref:UDP-GalNAc:beta-1, 3-N-acetylgalactosaminyltransferase 1 isoform X3 n=1 Tax=Lepidochelys kempii TaxID=8472 RepID=UPI003C6FCE8D
MNTVFSSPSDSGDESNLELTSQCKKLALKISDPGLCKPLEATHIYLVAASGFPSFGRMYEGNGTLKTLAARPKSHSHQKAHIQKHLWTPPSSCLGSLNALQWGISMIISILQTEKSLC